MRKAIAIFFISLFAASTTEAGQMLKLPLLVAHYQKHLSEGRSSSFLSFIKVHYLGTHGKDADNKEDQQLPFKSAMNVNFQVNYLVLPFEVLQTPLPLLIPEYNCYHSVSGLSNYNREIFHPPC